MYVERIQQSLFKKIQGLYPIVAVVGPRQAGKTTFLKHQLGSTNASYALFDDPDCRELFDLDIKKFEVQYLEGRAVGVLDEVQYGKDAGSKLKYLADSGHKLWITSSSETLLGKDVLSYLVGRVSILRLFPLCLPEFLAAKDQRETTPHILERMVWEHATYGGYPKVVTTPGVEEKKILLSDLYQTMILKDVARTFSIEDSRALENCARYLAELSGQLLSYQTLSNALGMSFPTAKKYLDALEKSYLFRRVPPFFTNATKELSKQPKVFFIDTGMRNVLVKKFENDLDGPLFENYVFCELLKAGFEPKFWRTKAKAEVDFIVEVNGKPVPIEVKIKPAPIGVPNGLKAFIAAHSPTNAFIVGHKVPVIHPTAVAGCPVQFVDCLDLIQQLSALRQQDYNGLKMQKSEG